MDDGALDDFWRDQRVAFVAAVFVALIEGDNVQATAALRVATIRVWNDR